MSGARPPRSWPATRSATSFADGKVYDVIVWSDAGDARAASTDIENLLIDTPDGGHVRLADVADVRIVPTPERHQARGRLAPHRRPRQRARPRPRRRRRATSRARSQDRQVPARLPRRAARRVRGAPGRAAAACCMLTIAAVIGIFLLLQASFESWRLAALVVPAPAGGAGRRRPGRLHRRRRHLARLAGRLPHRARASPPATASC